MSDLAPSPFKQDEWVRYTRHQTNAAIIVVLWLCSVAMALAVVDKYPYGAFTLAAIAAWFGSSALDSWDMAKGVRQSAEIRVQAENAFVTVFAATILKTLQSIQEADE